VTVYLRVGKESEAIHSTSSQKGGRGRAGGDRRGPQERGKGIERSRRLCPREARTLAREGNSSSIPVLLLAGEGGTVGCKYLKGRGAEKISLTTLSLSGAGRQLGQTPI